MSLSVRSQILLLFLPILLALSGVGGGLILIGHRSELLWGLHEQGRALAVSIAEYAAGHPPDQATLLHVAERNNITALTLVPPAGLPPLAIGTPTWPVADAAPAALVLEGPVTGPGGLRLLVRTPVEGGGWLELEIAADRYEHEQARMRRLALILIAAGLLAGLLTALLAAGRLTSRLEALTRRMRLLSGLGREEEGEVAGIRETEDLDDALRTMHSVLRARRAASERLSVENEQFRTVKDLVATLVERTQPAIDRLAGGQRVAARLVGGDAGQFLRLVETASQCHLLLGTMPMAEPLDQAVRAAATGDLIAARLQREKPADILADPAAARLAERMLIISWQAGDTSLQSHELRGGRVSAQPAPAEPVLAVGLLTGGGERLLRRYMERFTDVALESRFADLSAILQRRCVGLYALVAPAVEADTKDGCIADGTNAQSVHAR